MKWFVAGFFAFWIVFSIIIFPTGSDASKVARHKAGFTSVTRTHRSWFNGCHKDFVGYDVYGTRYGHPAHVLVCANPLSFYSYVR